jgi:PiT family inorganic phosphate transporter
MHSELLLVVVIAVALCFDFTNGFHDTANVIAPAISTRALSPRTAVTLAALLNFAGAFISLKVAATIAQGIIDSSQITETVTFAGLLGAIAWNLITWAFGLPSSSSHALIGGVIGALLAAAGGGAIHWQALIAKVVVPAVISPVVAFVVAAVAILAIYRLVGRYRPGYVRRGFRVGQIAASAMLALAHGTNDAQKTMGVITLTLVAHGTISPHHFHVPVWVVICAASAIALGTYAGGWRIIRTLGSRIISMDITQGFAAECAGAAVILVSSHYGYPLSSTHVISGGVVGAGAGRRLSAVRWGVAGHIVRAWVLTLPAAGVMGAAAFGLTDLLGGGIGGPLLTIALIAAGAGGTTLARRRRPALEAA